MIQHAEVSDEDENDGDEDLLSRSRWNKPLTRLSWRMSASTGNLNVGIPAVRTAPSAARAHLQTEAYGFRSVDRRKGTANSPATFGLSRSTSVRDLKRQLSPSESSISEKSTVPGLGDSGVDRNSSGSSISVGGFDDDGEADRRYRLQLYVLVSRCIAFPFNAQPTMSRDLPPPEKAKLTAAHLLVLKERFRLFIASSLTSRCLLPLEQPEGGPASGSSACRAAVIADGEFVTTVRKFYDAVFSSTVADRMTGNGAWTSDDLRSIWRCIAGKMAAETVHRTSSETFSRSATGADTRTINGDGIDGDTVGHGDGSRSDDTEDRKLIQQAVIDAWTIEFELIFVGKQRAFSSQNTGGDDEDDAIDAKKLTFTSTAADGRDETTIASSGNYVTFQLNRNRLYDMFQSVLGVKNYEHQLLYNALQLSNVDEQIVQVRREIIAMRERIDLMRVDPKYNGTRTLHELGSAVDALERRLDRPVVLLPSTDWKSRPWKILTGVSPMPGNTLSSDFLSSSILLSFQLEVTVLKVKGLKAIPPGKQIFCTIEVKGCDTMQTEHVRGSDTPVFDTLAEFCVKTPLPVVKLKLYMENLGIFSMHDGKLGQVVLTPTLLCDNRPTWYPMKTSKNSASNDVRIKAAAHLKRPPNLKHCGHLFSQGKNVWKKWEKRYFLLVQVSQCRYALCSYKGRKTLPQQLDGFTVEYCEPPLDGSLSGGRFYFIARKHGDWIKFAVDDELEWSVWVQTLCRATGQTHQPRPSTAVPVPSCRPSQATRDMHRAQQFGLLDENILADPSQLDHVKLFKKLHRLVLQQRLRGVHVSTGHLTTDQTFVLNEYCSRYHVDPYRRHLACLRNLLLLADAGYTVDSRLIREHFEYCANLTTVDNEHGFVFVEELYKLSEIRNHIELHVRKQLTAFRTVFPFGHPRGAIAETIQLLECVKVNDTIPPTDDQLTNYLKDIMEQNAMTSYKTFLDSVAIDYGDDDDDDDDEATAQQTMSTETTFRLLDKLEELSDLCVAHIGETLNFYDEEFEKNGYLLMEYCETFLQQFLGDMEEIIQQLKPNIEPSKKFRLFRQLSDHLTDNDRLRRGKSHQSLLRLYAIQVENYLDSMAKTILNRIEFGFGSEDWNAFGKGCSSSEYMMWAVGNLDMFVDDLRWPDSSLVTKLKEQVADITTKAIHTAAICTKNAFYKYMERSPTDTDYVIPTEVLVILNVIADCNKQPYKAGDDVTISDTKDNMTSSLIQQLKSVLKGSLCRLARFDQPSLLSSILTLTKVANDIADDFVRFVLINTDKIVETIVDDKFTSNILEMWYMSIMTLISDWMAVRNDQSLQSCQVTCLSYICTNCKAEFHKRGVISETVINCSTFHIVSARLLHQQAYINSTVELVSRS